MKKIVFIVIMMSVLFIFDIDKVDAQILYDITDMNVTKDSITFEGMAMRRYNNNDHGRLSKIEIVARGSAGELVGTFTTTESGSNYTYVNRSDDWSHNYYLLRCIKRGNASGSYWGCPVESEGYCSNGDCTLRNLDFKAKFSIANLKDKGANIKFYIRIYTDPSSFRTKNGSISTNFSSLTDYEETPIGVYTGRCKIGGKTCNNGINTLIDEGSKLNLNITQVSDVAKFAATPAHPQWLLDSGYKRVGNGCYFNDGSTVVISGQGKGSFGNTSGATTSYKTGVSGYKLKTNSSNVRGCGSITEAWSLAIWVQVSGEVTLNFENSTTVVTTCPSDVKNELKCSDGGYDVNCNNQAISIMVRAEEKGIGKPCSSGIVYSNTDTLYAYYTLNHTGDLMFNLDRGPIYSGGSFKFSVDYTNVASWNYRRKQKANGTWIDDINLCSILQIHNDTEECGTEENPKTCCVDKDIVPTHYSIDGGRTWIESGCAINNESSVKPKYEHAMAQNVYKEITGNNNLDVSFPDSNDIDKTSDIPKAGEWKCDTLKDSDGNTVKITSDTKWSPNTEWVKHCYYKLYDSYVDKITSEVRYSKDALGSDVADNYIKKSGEYYVPLKFPTDEFKISAKFDGLSSINGQKWYGTYECGVECIQKLYDLEKYSDRFAATERYNSAYLYFYRPIYLNNPFPNREASSNWIDWIKSHSNDLMNTYSDSNLEYTVYLDNDALATITSYNDNLFENFGYLDYSIGIDGKSNFINSNSSIIKREYVTHYRLGVGS